MADGQLRSRGVAARLVSGFLTLAAGSALAVGFAVSPIGAAVAGAAPVVQCGAAISTSMTLRANLTCSGYDGDALTITASNVTLNLGGHTITGDYDYAGVYIEGSRDTVQGGTIRDEAYGVESEYLYQDTLTGLTLTTEEVGVDAYTSELSTISFNHMSYMEFGTYFDYAYLTTIADNTMYDMAVGVLVTYEAYLLTANGNAITDVYAGVAIFAASDSKFFTNYLVGGRTIEVAPNARFSAAPKVTPRASLPQYDGPLTAGIEIINYTYTDVRPASGEYGYGLSITQNRAYDFEFGTYVNYMGTGKVASNTFETNYEGLYLGAYSSATVVQNVTDYNSYGIELWNPYHVAVLKSTASYNYEGIEIYNLYYDPGASVTWSTATYNSTYAFYAYYYHVPGAHNTARHDPDGSYNVTAS
jgi:hypothetical protein